MTTPTAKEIIRRGFKAIMSKGDDIPFDPDELDAVMAAVARGIFIKVRQGVINPSYLVSIAEDKKRRVDFLEDTRYDDNRRSLGMQPLKDILTREAPRLASGPPGASAEQPPRGEGAGRQLPEPKTNTP